MKFRKTPIHSVYVIETASLDDQRGSFSRVYCRDENLENEIDMRIAQINRSMNYVTGTVRGLHYQDGPASEIKRVTCVSGRVFDIILDLRAGSSTFLKWIGVELSSENKKIIHIPKGCAHGFQTLAPNTELIYFHSEPYTPDCYHGINIDDPNIDIQLPIDVVRISERDAKLPFIKPGFIGIKV